MVIALCCKPIMSRYLDFHFNIASFWPSIHRCCEQAGDRCILEGSFRPWWWTAKSDVFRENAFYLFSDNKIREVWSVIDKAAIEAQLG